MVSNGNLNEVDYPIVVRPQIREAQYPITDGRLSFVTNVDSHRVVWQLHSLSRLPE